MKKLFVLWSGGCLLAALLLSCSSGEEQRQLIKAHLDKGEFQQALPLLDQLLSKAPQDEPATAEAYNMRGVAHFELKNNQAALDNFNAAIKINNQDYRYYYNRGNVFRLLNNLSGALDDYNKAIELNKDVYDLFLNRSDVYFRMRRFNEALVDLNRAASLNPSDHKLYYNRGRTYAFMQKYDKAVEDLHHAVEMQPSHAEAHFHLALAEISKDSDKASPESCSHLRKALDLGYAEAGAAIEKYCHQE